MSNERGDRDGDQRSPSERSTAERRPPRRRVLATLGTGALGTIAGCGALNSDGESTDEPSIATANQATTEGGTPTPTETPTSDTATETATPLDGPTETWDEGGPPGREGWTVTFQDDFAGDELDWDVWDLGFGPASSVACTSSECARPENATVEDDRLVLTTTPEGAEHIPNDVWLADYTSGAISTASSFQQTYGFFEAKAKIPVQPGALPAFWAWTDEGSPPEIDFYEIFGDDPRPSFGIHYDCNDNGKPQSTGTRIETEATVDERFHIFGCSWAPDHVVWYVDGSERYRVDGWAECLSAEPMFPILSTYVVDVDDYSESDTAVTGDHADAEYPYTHEVEWIRVWQHEDWE